MKKINLNKPFTKPNGELIDSLTLASQLSDAIAMDTRQENSRKLNNWSEDLAKSGQIEIDEVDLEFLTKWIDTANGFTVRFRGMLLNELANQK